MMKQIHLVMPMGGKGSRFFENGFVIPKPIIKLNGKPFFYWATQSIVKFVDVIDVTFVVLQEHVDEFHIDSEILQYYPKAQIVVIPEVLDGAVLTCIRGIMDINDKLPILFNDCDHMFVSESFNQFCREESYDKIDGGLLTFESNEPKYSFLEYNDKGEVIQTVEKVVVSNHAICGAYYFRNKEVFLKAAEQYLIECCYNEFFVSGVYNIMIQQKMHIVGFKTDVHIPFGTPDEYYCAEMNQNLGMVEV